MALGALPAIFHHLLLHARAGIDAAIVVAVGGVGRHISFARPEREPADGGAALLADHRAKLDAADEGDQRRRIDGLCSARPGNPTPALTYECPSPVMERRETPWCVIDPRPSPRIDPCPVAVAVRRPT